MFWFRKNFPPYIETNIPEHYSAFVTTRQQL